MRNATAMPLEGVYAELASGGLVTRALELARDEDLGDAGDVTSLVCIEPGAVGRADLVARAPGTIAGLAALPELVRGFGARVDMRVCAGGGTRVQSGHVVAQWSGRRRDLLTLERAALNLVGRLSGIAT